MSRDAAVEYIYRGNEEEPLVEELERGAIHGSKHDIYRGELNTMPTEPPYDVDITSLDWESLVVGSQAVTGGVSDSLAQTRRFSGANSYAMVLSANDTIFKPIEYTYDWFNENLGVYDHILSSATGEIRLTGDGHRRGGDLYGSVKKRVRMDRPNVTEVRHWGGRGEIPGFGGSRFEDESEWVALTKDVSLSNAIEGVVSVQEPLSIRVKYTRGKDMIPKDAPSYDQILGEAYERYRDPLPPWTNYYLIVVEDFQDYKKEPRGGWATDDILAAYRDDGEVKPEHVPAKFRGANG